MVKIVSLFKRNYDTDHLVRNEVTEGAEWVINGEGVATVKWDGTCCMIKDGKFYKRYDAKKGKTLPDGFIPAQEPDAITGHWPGWLLVGTGPEDKWHREAYQNLSVEQRLLYGTYELVGPKINGNKSKFVAHYLIRHGENVGVNGVADAPRTFDELKEWFEDEDIEGIVWHHPDGRMVKIKKRDFGYKW